MTHLLHDFLTEILREQRKDQSPLRLGILLPEKETAFIEALWTNLEARLFTPRLFLQERYRDAFQASLSDDHQFVLSEGLHSYEDVLNSVSQAIHAGELDLLVVPPGKGFSIAEALRSTDGGLLPDTSAAFGLLRPTALDRPLLLGDLLFDTTDGSERLAQTVRMGSEILGAIGLDTPRTALLAAVETVSEGIPATVAARKTEEMLADEKGFHVQGPLSMDLAISPYAAEKKKVSGEVAGRADFIVGPNLTVSRGVLHALTCLCEEPSATLLVGGPVPIAASGTCDGQDGVILSILFGGIVAGYSLKDLYLTK